MVFLESNASEMQKRVSRKIAIDSEFNDWVTNKSDEDWMVVRGLPRLASMDSKEWQSAARRQVADMIKQVLKANKTSLDFMVLYVGNPLRHQTGPTLYNVRLDSVYASKTVRELYSGFFRANRPVPLPANLKRVEVRNKITLETKIRISIMRQIGSIWKESNQGSSFKVQGFAPRPVLVTTPARGSSERQRSYTFIQAVTSLNTDFNDEHLTMIFQNVKNHHQGSLRSLFLVIDDDDRERCLQLVQAHQASQAQRRGARPGGSAITTSGIVSGSGTGMDVEAFRASITSPPPPPSEPPRERVSQSESDSDYHRLKKGLKRRHQSSSSSSPPPKDRKDKKDKKKKKKRSRRSPSPSSSGSGSSSRSTPPRKSKRH